MTDDSSEGRFCRLESMESDVAKMFGNGKNASPEDPRLLLNPEGEGNGVPHSPPSGEQKGEGGNEEDAAVPNAKTVSEGDIPPPTTSPSGSSHATSVPNAGPSSCDATKEPTLAIQTETVGPNNEEAPLSQDQGELSEKSSAPPVPLDTEITVLNSPHGVSPPPPDPLPFPGSSNQGSPTRLVPSTPCTQPVHDSKRSCRQRAVHYCSTCHDSFGTLEELELHRLTHYDTDLDTDMSSDDGGDLDNTPKRKRARLSSNRDSNVGFNLNESGISEPLPGPSHAESPSTEKRKYKTPHSQCEVCHKWISTPYLPQHQQTKQCKPIGAPAENGDGEGAGQGKAEGNTGKVFKNPRTPCNQCHKLVCIVYLEKHQQEFCKARVSKPEVTEKVPESKSADQETPEVSEDTADDHEGLEEGQEDKIEEELLAGQRGTGNRESEARNGIPETEAEETMQLCPFHDCLFRHYPATRAKRDEHMEIHYNWRCYGIQCPHCDLLFCWEQNLKSHLQDPEHIFYDFSGPEELHEGLWGPLGRKQNSK